MRYLALLLLSGVLLAQKPLSVTGTVENVATGEPVAKVNLSLRGNNPNPAPTVLWATSDAEGKFSFADVPAGSYVVMVEKAGFLRIPLSSKESKAPMTTFTVRPGATLDKMTFYLQPHAVIIGRVVDEEGEPVERATVQVVVPRNGQLAPQQGMTTNDLGEFRIAGLMPGKYYLVAQRQSMGAPSGKLGYLATFYPSSSEFTGATPIELKSGQTSTPTQIMLRRGSVFKVSGRVVGAWPRGQNSSVSLLARRTPGTGQATTFRWGGSQSALKPDGSFEIPGASPGDYHLVLISFGNGRVAELGRMPIAVAQADLEDITLQVQPPLKVQGKVRVDGEGEAQVEGMSISLYPSEAGMGMAMGQVSAAGAFELNDVSRLAYQVNFRAPANTYVKKIVVGDKEVTAAGLDFSNGATEMEIVLGTKPAKLTGSVKRVSENQAPGRVILLPEGMAFPERLFMSLPGVMPIAPVDQEGSFTFSGLPPGKFRLLAVEDIQFDGPKSKETIEKLEAKMTKVEIAEGATGTAALVQLSRKELAEFGLDLGQ